MAIEDIFRALEEQAEAECDAILGAARQQAAGIVAEAELEAERIKRDRVEAAEVAAKRRTSQTINAARLANRRDLAGVRDKAMERVFQEAEQRLAQVRSNSSYQQMFEALASEALGAAAAHGSLTLRVAPEDAALAEQAAATYGCGVDATLTTGGGVMVSAADGRITVSNTVEDRLTKVRRGAQSHVAEMLFE